MSYGGWTKEAQAHFVMALAQWQLNHHDKSLMALDRANEILRSNAPDFSGVGSDEWHNWLICQHFRHEAESLIHGDNQSGSGDGPSRRR
jgi:hypothetical protein